jgi:two-component system, LuxR family, response regulator FixJ
MKATQPKVFFVDDEPEMRTMVADALGKLGYKVTCFANAQHCLSEVEKTGCHLLISGVKLPGMDGMVLLSSVKRIAPWVPVIILTGYGNVQMAVYATKIGAEEFLEKPIDGTTLVNKVKEVLSRSEYDNCPNASKLTKTEKKVLKLILDGNDNKEIAFKMNCALRTVEFHHTHIYRKLGVDNAVDLIKKVMAMFPDKIGV